MTAIVLAAGYSTRLYPITKYFPKALLPIGNKPVAGYMLDDLIQQKDIARKILITNNRYRSLFSYWIGSDYPNSKIELANDRTDSPQERLGAIGDILFVIQKFRINDDLLVLSSDSFTSLALEDMSAFFFRQKGVINAVYDTKDSEVIREKLGCVVLARDKITAFEEKPLQPVSTVTSIPYYIFPKNTLPFFQTYIRDGNPVDAPGSFVAWLVGRVPVYGYLLSPGNFYYDVGTIAVYNQLAETYRNTLNKI